MIRFALPWLLLLYMPFAGVIIYALRKKRPTIKIPSIRPFNEANPAGELHISTRLPFILYAIASAILIFALARPQKGIERLKQKAEGIDIMLAIDLSGSMEALDLPSTGYRYDSDVFKALKNKTLKPRIEIAKQEIRKFIAKRPNDRIGLIAFAPLPYVACPPTLDHAWLEQHLTEFKAGIINDGTNIAGPIASAVSRLKDSDSKRKVLVLFTDGSNTVDSSRVTPRQAAKLAKTFDVIIYTVGIGSRNAYIVQKAFLGGQSLRPFGSQFDEKLLRDIAATSDGKYFAASDSKGLEEVMKEIDKLEKTTKEQPRYVNYSEYGPHLLSIALAMILLAFALQNTIMLKVP